MRARLVAAAMLGIGSGGARADLRVDLVVVEGREPARVLPVIAASARAAAPNEPSFPPILLVEPGREAAAEDFIARYAPVSLAVVAPGPARLRRFASAARRVDLVAPDAEIDERLAQLAFRARTSAVFADPRDAPAALVAATLAALRGVPLLLVEEGRADASLAAAGAPAAVFVGAAPAELRARAARRRIALAVVDAGAGADLVATALGRERLSAIVLANPADRLGPFDPPALSLLAPLLAAERRSPLLLADDPEPAAAAFFARHRVPPRSVTLIGDSLALPPSRAPDPEDPARTLRVPPLAGVVGGRPAETAVGRLVAQDAFDLSLVVARTLHASRVAPRPAESLFLVNAQERFPLGEAIARATAAELERAGFSVRARWGAEVDAFTSAELADKALVAWEGHPRDLLVGDDGALAAADLALAPSLFVLQGCYTLDRNDPYVLFERGALAVLGSSAAIYSAPGSAFAKVFLEEAMIGGEALGAAAVHARNYLVALADLTRRREHPDAARIVRAAMSFDLWGDPALRLPLPPPRPGERVRARIEDGRLIVHVPRERAIAVRSGAYHGEFRAGAQLGGLVGARGEERRMIEMVFAHVPLPEGLAPPPRALGRLAEADWASVYAPATSTLYVLVHGDAIKEGGEIAFELGRAAPPAPRRVPP